MVSVRAPRRMPSLSALVRTLPAVGLVLGTGLAYGFMFSPSAAAQSTATTASVELDSKDGQDIPGVFVNCELTVKEDGNLTVKCNFTNTNDSPRRFIYCMMIDLKEPQEVEGVPDQSFRLVQEPLPGGGEEARCEPGFVFTLDDTTSDYHFGCKEVEVPAGGTASAEFSTEPGGYKAPEGEDPEAQDFQVTYADIVDLTSKPGKQLNETSCQQVRGQGNFLTPVDDGAGIWVFDDADFIDPVVGFQPLAGTVSATASLQYATYENLFCLPLGFPEAVAQLPPCPPQLQQPPTDVNINLFWFESEVAPPEARFPVFLNVQTEGDMNGLRIQTEPPAHTFFEIPGARMTFGHLQVCAAQPQNVCQPPSLAEGRRLGVLVKVHDWQQGGLLFQQGGRFIHDTNPPRVVEAQVEALPGGMLGVNAIASDATTSPIHASIWYSTDAGLTWRAKALTPTTDLQQELGQRAFQGVAGPVATPAVVKYFLQVHDRVQNTNFYGVGQVTVAPGNVPSEGPGPEALAAVGLMLLAAVALGAPPGRSPRRRRRRPER